MHLLNVAEDHLEGSWLHNDRAIEGLAGGIHDAENQAVIGREDTQEHGSGTLTVEPGTYYIVDGDLEFDTIGTITCDCSASGSGVTFVLTGTTPAQIGTFSFNNITTVNLRAPSDPSYDYPGILNYVDRDAPYGVSTFVDMDSVTYNGAVYAPSQKVSYHDLDYNVQTDCAVTIAFRLAFSDTDGMTAENCVAYGTQPGSILSDSALVQ